MVNTQRFKAYGLLIGVFLLGSVAGAGASWAISQRDIARDIEGIALGEREPFERRRLHGLSRKLDLSSEQEQRIQAIFRKHRRSRLQITRDLRERCGEPLRQHKARLDAEIKSVLTAEQRLRFEELIQKQEKWFSERRRR
jgi:Spy/CpxP family protein refolding chaperone